MSEYCPYSSGMLMRPKLSGSRYIGIMLCTAPVNGSSLYGPRTALCSSASTLHTLQSTTAEPGFIFYWRFSRFLSEELRWLATYVALSRPPFFKQLSSIGMPSSLRDIVEGLPLEGIFSRLAAMLDDIEESTRLREAELMAHFGWTEDCI